MFATAIGPTKYAGSTAASRYTLGSRSGMLDAAAAPADTADPAAAGSDAEPRCTAC